MARPAWVRTARTWKTPAIDPANGPEPHQRLRLLQASRGGQRRGAAGGTALCVELGSIARSGARADSQLHQEVPAGGSDDTLSVATSPPQSLLCSCHPKPKSDRSFNPNSRAIAATAAPGAAQACSTCAFNSVRAAAFASYSRASLVRAAWRSTATPCRKATTGSCRPSWSTPCSAPDSCSVNARCALLRQSISKDASCSFCAMN
ncbi:hypothetical protein VAR608DRAFT_2381 [Variovorax sp. HW608]|nr:hypothetical protein VAR608DRAFT_2381 [Variovorax sp. HW608]